VLGGTGQTKPEQTTGKYLVRQKQQIQLPACCLQVQSAERRDLDLEGVKWLSNGYERKLKRWSQDSVTARRGVTT